VDDLLDTMSGLRALDGQIGTDARIWDSRAWIVWQRMYVSVGLLLIGDITVVICRNIS